MKNGLLAIVILILGVLAFIEFRYMIVVDAPVVAKFDRVTGDIWIVNSGVWRKVDAESSECAVVKVTPPQASAAAPSK